MQREAMLKFAEALDCVSTALRRDECGDPRTESLLSRSCSRYPTAEAAI